MRRRDTTEDDDAPLAGMLRHRRAPKDDQGDAPGAGVARGSDLALEVGLSRLLEVGLSRLEDYVAGGRRGGAALATIQHELAILRRGFKLAVWRQQLPFRPAFPTLRIDNARQGFFEREAWRRCAPRCRSHCETS